MPNTGDILLTKSSTTEKVVKSYHCSKMKFPRCDGYLTVTNKRVIFHGLPRPRNAVDQFANTPVNPNRPNLDCRIVNEVDVNSVSGISSYYGTKTSIEMLVTGIIMAVVSMIFIISMFSLSVSTPSSWAVILGFLFFIPFFIGLLLACLCQKQVFFLQIFSSQATGAPITLGEGYGNFSGTRPLYAMTGLPIPETDQMMRELGALVSDIKELGDKAIELWTEKKKSDAIPATIGDDTEEFLRDAANRLK